MTLLVLPALIHVKAICATIVFVFCQGLKSKLEAGFFKVSLASASKISPLPQFLTLPQQSKCTTEKK